MTTYLFGSLADFKAWCARNGISAPIQSGVRHLPDLRTAGAMGHLPQHRLIVLGADKAVRQRLVELGFNVPPDPLEQQQEQREQNIREWEHRINNWCQQNA